MSSDTKETILFVDDEVSILEIANTFFSGRGYQVLTADNGKKAIELLRSHQVDCCLTDINMPEMNGLEFAEFIRQYDNTIPVVVMTGYPSLDNIIHTLKNGVVDFLIKPVNLQQMELCIQRVMRERKLFVENLILTKEVEGKAKLETLNKELLDKIEELNNLNRILADFSALRESTDVFKQLVELALQIATADRTCFYLVNEAAGQFVPIASIQSGTSGFPPEAKIHGEPPDSMSNAPLHETDPHVHKLIQDVIRDDRPLLIVRNGSTWANLPPQILSYMLVPLKIRGKTFGVLSAAISRGNARFSEKDLYYLSFMTNKAASAIENLALYENIYHNLLATLYAFVKAIEARDPYTKQHSSRVTRLAQTLAKAMGCTEEQQDILNVAGLLHDIGKIGIRDEILLKPGRLNPEEYRVIQQHPVIGAEIMDRLGLWHREKQIVRSHHERFDGKGYPDGLKGNEIPLLARILSIADVYDAMASDRAYRQRMEQSMILGIIYDGSGKQFDPAIIDVFRHLYERGEVAKVTAEEDS